MTDELGIDAIVKRAQQLGPRDRADYVRTACAEDPTLLSGVLTALGGHERIVRDLVPELRSLRVVAERREHAG